MNNELMFLVYYPDIIQINGAVFPVVQHQTGGLYFLYQLYASRIISKMLAALLCQYILEAFFAV